MADHKRAGTTLGRFLLEEEIGAGAAGVVYRARDTVLGTTVALKVIHPELLGDVEVKERFKREILLSRRVQHKGVCRIYDLHEMDEDGAVVLGLAMELLDGETLATEIHHKGRLSPARTLEVLEELAPALSAAHEAGVIHRDLKPGNVMVTASGPPGATVKLLDFGMATADDVMRVTRPGNTVGSLRFIAPEVWEGQAATHLSDLYALGVLLFACLSGRLPYEAKSPGEMFQALKKPPPSLVGDIPDVTPAMDAVVQKAMSKRPNERQRSARQILEDFRRAVEGEQTFKVRESALFARATLPAGPVTIVPIRTPVFLLACAGALLAAVALAALIGALLGGGGGGKSAATAASPRAADAHLASWQEPSFPTDEEPAAAVEPAVDAVAVAAPVEAEEPREPSERRPERPRVARADDERAALQGALRKRGIQLADLPDVERLDDSARKAEAQGDSAGAKSALKQAKAIVDKTAIDRGFIMMKQKRLVRMLDRSSAKVRDKVRPLESDVAKAFAARDYEKANHLLNRALAAAR